MKKILRALVPARFKPKFDANENLIQFVALCVTFSAVLFLFAASSGRAPDIKWGPIWEWVSIILTVVGTLWIASGVIYARPGTKPMTDIEELSRHVTETFAYASRTCLFGISIVFAGFVALIISKLVG